MRIAQLVVAPGRRGSARRGRRARRQRARRSRLRLVVGADAMIEPRIRVSAILRWQGRSCSAGTRSAAGEVWLLPGRRRAIGREPVEALQRELAEETGLFDDGTEVPLEGPVAIVDSIAPRTRSYRSTSSTSSSRRTSTGSLEDVGVAGRGRPRPSGVPHATSSTRSRCTRRSSASCSAGSRAIRRSTSARCGCRELGDQIVTVSARSDHHS